MKLIQSTAFEQKRFNLWSLSPALHNLRLLLVLINLIIWFIWLIELSNIWTTRARYFLFFFFFFFFFEQRTIRESLKNCHFGQAQLFKWGILWRRGVACNIIICCQYNFSIKALLHHYKILWPVLWYSCLWMETNWGFFYHFLLNFQTEYGYKVDNWEIY